MSCVCSPDALIAWTEVLAEVEPARRKRPAGFRTSPYPSGKGKDRGKQP